MANFFINIFLFFHHRKWIFYLFLFVIIAVLAGISSGIRLEEDISGARTDDSRLSKYEYVIRNFKFAEKLIIHIYQNDSFPTADPDSMIQLANLFAGQLNQKFDSTYIRNFFLRADDSNYIRLVNTVHAHLPLFLNSKDYQKMDSLLEPERLQSQVRANYKILLSPASMVIKKQLISDPLGLRNLGMQKMKSLQVDENYVLIDGYVFSKDQKHLFIFITPANPPSETEKNSRLVKGIDQICQQLAAENPGKHLEYFGSIAVAASNAGQLKKDILLTISIAIFLIFSLIAWYFKNWLIPLLGFLPALFGGVFALAVIYLVKGNISAIALGIGSVILGLIIDYALYLINQYRLKKSVITVLKDMSQTIVICCLTSAGAFLCLVFLDSAVLHDLGWFAALSVTGAAAFSLIILPHFLTHKLIPLTTIKNKENIIDRISSIALEKKRSIIFLICVAGIISCFFSHKADFSKDLNELNFVTQKLQDAEKNMDISGNSGLKNMYIVACGKTFEHALKINESVQHQLSDLQQANTIVKYSGIQQLLMSDSMQHERISAWNKFWTIEKKARLAKNLREAAKKTGFKNDAFTGFSDWLNQGFPMLSEKDSKAFQTTFFSDWINEKPEVTMISSLVKVRAENKNMVYATFKNQDDVIVFDRQNLTTQFVSQVKTDFDLLVMLSMIFVSILLLISFGRIEMGIVTALPMFLGWLITLGFMGIFGLTFNIFNIILSSFVFGLGVDYSILMMRGLLSTYKYGNGEIKTYKVSIFLSAATTLIGVAVLFFARHPALKSIALVSVVGMISVVLITYTIQPLFADWFIFKRRLNNKFPVTARIFFKTLITWGNIVLIALIMTLTGMLIYTLAPVSRKKKEYLFHALFSKLCKLYILVTFPTNGKLLNPYGEDFSRPSIIISNHQSLIETPAFLRLTPKILILTNEWVFKSPVFGPIARLGGFINVEDGLEANLEKLKIKFSEGYSILIFPEGHRSADQHIQRFHRGAFFLAEKLKIDLLPILVFGSGDFLAKGDFWGKPNGFRMKIMQRIPSDDPSFGLNYSERTRQIRKFFIQSYESFQKEEGNTFYYRKKLLLNYVFKGPVLEWYLRTKLKLENNYQIFHELIPAEGEILDLGCGYGFIAYMLLFTSGKRRITGVDYDAEKIKVAENCFSKNDRINFICADVSTYEITPKNAFLLGDVLHYLTPENQESLLRKCCSNLNPGGTLLIREADSNLKYRHQKSKITEFFSTHIGFNLTNTPGKKLYFTSAEKIRAITLEYGLSFETIDNKKITSNNLFLIRKNKPFE